MANLKEIRTRIVSVNSTMQITSAMKMVSAAKLKRAQDAITKMRAALNKFVIRGIKDLIRVPAIFKIYIGTERAHVKVFLQEAQVSVMRQ